MTVDTFDLPDALSIKPLSIQLVDVQVTGELELYHETITLTFRVIHRDSGFPTVIQLSERRLLRGEPRPDAIRRMLKSVVCHEVDEVLQLNGVRIREPHP